MRGLLTTDSRVRVIAALGTLCVAAAIVLAPSLSRAAHAQTEEARLFLSVADQNGKLITDLQPDQVAVVEDGQRRETTGLRLVGSATPRVSLLVDNGNSTREILADIQRAARGFIDAMPPEVEVELVAFGGRARMVERWTTDRAELLDAVGQIAPDSGAARFVDALEEARRRYEDLRDDDDDFLFPHIVVVAGDGRESSNVNERRINQMIQGLYGLPATIHVLLLRTANIQSQDIVQSELSIILTENTRGLFERASVGGTLPDVLGKIAERVAAVAPAQSQQYLLTFERPEGTQAQQTALQVDRPDASRIRASGDGRFD